MELPVTTRSVTNSMLCVRNQKNTDFLNNASKNNAPIQSGSIRGVHFLFDLSLSRIICNIGAKEGEKREFEKMRFALHLINTQIESEGGYSFHGALIEKYGLGAVVSAPSGTGKSTLCSRLPPDWTVWGDDESIAIKQANGAYRIHTLPTWTTLFNGNSNRSWKTQNHIPLTAIFFLEQSDRDEIIPIRSGRAAIFLNASTNSHHYHKVSDLDINTQKVFQKQIFENACEISAVVPSYILKTHLNGRPWELIDQALRSSL